MLGIKTQLSLFMLVHSALTNVNNTSFDFNSVLVKDEINIIKCCRSIVHS